MDSYNATACYSRVHTWPHSSAAMFHIQSRLAEGALPRAGCPFNSGASTVFRYWWASSYACIVTARMLSFAAGLVLPCFILGLQRVGGVIHAVKGKQTVRKCLMKGASEGVVT
ncbi:hypothetical protein ABBQ38_008157 [Trebouxia sp. C0009 RCD-2024]